MATDFSLSTLVDRSPDLVPELFVHNADRAIEGCIYWSVIGKSKWGRIVRQLPKICPFPEDTIGPGGDSCFFAVYLVSRRLFDPQVRHHLRAVILIGTDIKLIGRHESDPGFRVELKSQTGYHLKVELVGCNPG